MDDVEGALEDANSAIDVDETWVKAYFRRAKCLMRKDESEDAVRTLRKAMEVDETNAQVREFLRECEELAAAKPKDCCEMKVHAAAAYRNGDYEGAIALYDDVLEDIDENETKRKEIGGASRSALMDLRATILLNRAECYRQS